VALTGEAVFDYVSGELRRASRWMADHGLEWLGRLIIEPCRLWQRILIGNPLYLWRVLKQYAGAVALRWTVGVSELWSYDDQILEPFKRRRPDARYVLDVLCSLEGTVGLAVFQYALCHRRADTRQCL
jgi:hypothetical protein